MPLETREGSMRHAAGRLRLALVLLLPALFAPGQTRELHWRSLEVKARLDAEGALHVTERQAMVFTGDWNGGERKFRVERGQTLSFQGLRRVAPSGQAQPLSGGDLSAVDQFVWKDPVTLRWRSRLPSDPSFDGTQQNSGRPKRRASPEGAVGGGAKTDGCGN
jgi:hypothetical protein